MMLTVEQIAALATDDFQNRGGNYPKSGCPVSIDVYWLEEDLAVVHADYKNTPESVALRDFEDYLTKKGANASGFEAWQVGDYKDDWVTVNARVFAKM